MDGYMDGYVDGYAPSDKEVSFIRVVGETIDGTGEEVFEIRRNGKFRSKKLFRTIEKIDGSVNIVDPDYEPFVLEVLESDPISIMEERRLRSLGM